MTELGYDASDLDARLAKIDRRLREIQEGLAPEREPTAGETDQPGPVEMEDAAEGIEPLRETAPEATLGFEEPAPEPPPVTETPPVEEPTPEPAPIEEPPPEASEQIEAPEPPAPPEAPEPPAPPDAAHPHRGREGPLAEILQQARREQHPDSVQERLARQVEELTEMHAGLLSSIFDAIEALRGALARMPRLHPAEISVSAGPFASVEAVRAFEGLLASLPGVREVTLRGYEGEDRAVLDVELSSPTP
jgi:hypothetical protein